MYIFLCSIYYIYIYIINTTQKNMDSIRLYGMVPVKKIEDFYNEKVFFYNSELRELYNEMLNKIDFPFKLHYVTFNLNKNWYNLDQVLNPEIITRINKFTNMLTTDCNDVKIPVHINNTYSVPDYQLIRTTRFLDSNRIDMQPGDLYYPNFKPSSTNTKKLDSYWFSTNLSQACAYIQNKAFANRYKIDIDFSGALFVHHVRSTTKLSLLNMESDDVQSIIRSIGITEHMLIHESDIVGRLVCIEINKLLEKYKYAPIDGVYFRNSAESIILCNTSGLTISKTFIYSVDGSIFPPKIIYGTDDIQKKKIFKTFYSPSKIWVESRAYSYRHKLTQLMTIDDDIKGGLDPSKVNTSLISVVLASVTNVLRPYIYKALVELNEYMSKYGKFILAGGDAINMLLAEDDRSISPDIDTKFILNYNKFANKFDNYLKNPSEQQTKNEAEYFHTLLKSKNHLWYVALKKVLDSWNDKSTYERFYHNLLKPLESTPLFNILGVTFIHPNQIKKNKPFRKRHTVMHKNSKGDPPFLFDVELFAVDMYLNSIYTVDWKTNVDGKTIWKNKFSYADFNEDANITGLLDLAYTKPTHIGYDLGSPSLHTHISLDPFLFPVNYEKFFGVKTALNTIDSVEYEVGEGELPEIEKMILPIANYQYVKNDVELLNTLQLRKGTKLDKDLYRLKILEKYYNQNEIKKNIKTDNIDKMLRLEQMEYLKEKSYTNNYYSKKYYNKKNYTKNIISIDDIVPFKMSHIIKFLAIPKRIENTTIDENNTAVDLGFIECKFDDIYQKKYDTTNRYNYNFNKWDTCCDVVPNQIPYRFYTKQIGRWGTHKNTQTQMLCILSYWLKYLENIKKIEIISDRLPKIGVMVYGFRNEFLKNILVENTVIETNNLLINSILIFATSLRYISGKLSGLSKKVFDAIFDLLIPV
jgi:hypothetical protein